MLPHPQPSCVEIREPSLGVDQSLGIRWQVCLCGMQLEQLAMAARQEGMGQAACGHVSYTSAWNLLGNVFTVRLSPGFL